MKIEAMKLRRGAGLPLRPTIHKGTYSGPIGGPRLVAPLIFLLALSACQTTRYVKIPCLSAEQYKQLEQAEPPKIGDKLTGNAGEDIKTISGSAIRLRSWGRGNLQVLSGCVG